MVLAWQSTEPGQLVLIERQRTPQDPTPTLLGIVPHTVFVDPACGAKQTCCYRVRAWAGIEWSETQCVKTRAVFVGE